MSEIPTKGLGSLLSTSKTPSFETTASQQTRILDIPLEAIVPNPRQHRRHFDSAALDSLAESIKAYGMLQPVVVRPVGSTFELIAGERRWRAARLAGLESIRAVSKPSSEESSLVISIVENLQRENLDPIEEASAYKALIDQSGITHEKVAAYVGRDRATVTNALRLLELPASIQAKLVARSITPGHARVLLAVTDPDQRLALADRIAEESLSVRQLENIVYGTGTSASRARIAQSKPAHLASLEQRISERLGVPVIIHEGRRGGKLVIRFKSNQEFLRILEGLGVDSTDV